MFMWNIQLFQTQFWFEPPCRKNNWLFYNYRMAWWTKELSFFQFSPESVYVQLFHIEACPLPLKSDKCPNVWFWCSPFIFSDQYLLNQYPHQMATPDPSLSPSPVESRHVLNGNNSGANTHTGVPHPAGVHTGGVHNTPPPPPSSLANNTNSGIGHHHTHTHHHHKHRHCTADGKPAYRDSATETETTITGVSE